MTFLGMWACQWRELKPISFGGKPKAGTTTSKAVSEEDGAGFQMGTGRRSGGSDGAGVYEMVGMMPKDEAV